MFIKEQNILRHLLQILRLQQMLLLQQMLVHLIIVMVAIDSTPHLQI